MRLIAGIRRFVAVAVFAVMLIGTLGTVEGQQKSSAGSLPEDWVNLIDWRSIGPANMSGRITSIAVYEQDPSIWYVASASGGLLKTINNGSDFEHQFDRETTVSIGDVQVSATNPDLVWVGTGEANPRNSVSWGDGVYKSVDGGKTWKNMGLKKSFQIGRIAIHPENHDIVYVGALGRLWGPSEERGLFKTTDGGATWKKILYVDDKTGVIDVQMNPKNPNELLVATYERQRDGFDGNDPEKRFGPGAGIYKTTDGGETFNKVTEGLPTCNLGRIGLDYFASDPAYVVAIVESEKIAKLPENSAFLGVRGEDADVGARITAVTEKSPAEAAELKVNDIIVKIDDELVLSNEKLLAAIRKRQAGDKIRVEAVRDQEIVSLTIELAKYPENARQQNPFTGTLGGQAENLQDQQGPDAHEYGGIYLSKDGGTKWERINTLNPRPMYYSQIRIDPKDRNNIFVCGTSLYRSFDGGKTFRGDGVTDGIHVDHHALWIDERDPRHMILGNDGGIYVTWDTMQNWDHHSQFAIGQFYHAGVDTRVDYRVYGGLQDNGSWGGPVRSGRDRGPVNTDWFSVGGGDGFVTLADPNDPDQIYYESQNGGMGRVNLRTGERGFMRPRAERGVRYRFNWKTPFMLSPHNSQIFYTAGNYVFRSFSKGDNLVAISPEITNTSGGAGSAIDESPVEAGVIYAGTTDGAVWMTKDGGQNWVPIFSKPEERKSGEQEKKEESESAGESGKSSEESGKEEKTSGEEAGGEKAESGKEAEGKPDAPKTEMSKESAGEKSESEESKSEEGSSGGKDDSKADDRITGNWLHDPNFGGESLLKNTAVRFRLDSADKTVTGMLIGRQGEYEMRNVSYDAESGAMKFKTDTPRGVIEFDGKINEDVFSGKANVVDEKEMVEFRYVMNKRGGVPTSVADLRMFESALFSTVSLVSAGKQEVAEGVWNGVVESDQIPGGRLEFSVTLERTNDELTGRVESAMGTLDISDVKFNGETGTLTFNANLDGGVLDFEAKIAGNVMKGNFEIQGMDQVIPFEANRKPAENQEVQGGEEAKSGQEQQAGEERRSGTRGQGQGRRSGRGRQAAEQQEKSSEEPGSQEEAARPVSPLAGKWSGTMTSSQAPRGGGRGGRGGGEFSMEIAPDKEGKLAGTMMAGRGGESSIVSATLDETKNVRIVVDNERFEMVMEGKLSDDGKLAGTIQFGENFTMEFTAEKSGGVAESAPAERKTAGGTLESLLPGPRWVSSITASRYKAGRVYISLDGHRSNDDGIYIFVSEDYGKTWKSIRGNLPDNAGSVRVLREDIRQENILYCGCEFSAWVSVDRGQSWTKFGDLPTVAVHEFAQHTKSGDVVAATHGRSLWVADVTPLRQMSATSVSTTKLFEPSKVIRWRAEPRAGDSGTRRFVGENPPTAARIFYSLAENSPAVSLTISTINGEEVFRADDAPTGKGLHVITWDMRQSTGGGGNRRFSRLVSPGTYLVEMRAGADRQQQMLVIEADPNLPADASPEALESYSFESEDESGSEAESEGEASKDLDLLNR